MNNKKYNKKRNTAFLFEILIEEISKSVIQKNTKKKKKIFNLIKEFFNSKTILSKELKLYKEMQQVFIEKDKNIIKKLIERIVSSYGFLNQNEIFLNQSKLISRINKEISPTVMNNFVPNYKNLAVINNLFGLRSNKERVLLENKIIEQCIQNIENQKEESKVISNFEYKVFAEKFNKKYFNSSLLESQKKLLNKYIYSFLDNGIDFKLFLNEEIEFIKKLLKEYVNANKNDSETTNKINSILNIVDDFKSKEIDSFLLEEIMKLQELSKELNNVD